MNPDLPRLLRAAADEIDQLKQELDRIKQELDRTKRDALRLAQRI
jgi:hypothetical protein